MEFLYKRKFIVVAALYALSGCSKHPETVAIDMPGISESLISVEAKAYVLSSDINDVYDRINAIKSGKTDFNQLIKSDDTPSFPISNDETKKYLEKLEHARQLYKELPDKAKQEQLTRENYAQEEISSLTSTLDELKDKLSNFNSLIKAETQTVEALTKEIEVVQQTADSAKVQIIQKINDYIVDNRIPVKKFDETRAKLFGWDVANKRKGQCPQGKNRYYVDISGVSGECIYFYLDYSIRNSVDVNHHEDLAKVIKSNIGPYLSAEWALKMTIGQNFALYKRLNDANKSLEQAKIVAQNQTDVDLRQLERDIGNVTRQIDNKKLVLTNLKENPVTVEGLVLQDDRLNSLSDELYELLRKLADTELDRALKDGVIAGKSEFTGTTGTLASTNGEGLVLVVTLSNGFQVTSEAIYTDLNQDWADQIVIKESNSFAVNLRNRSIKDDKHLLAVALEGLDRYKTIVQKKTSS